MRPDPIPCWRISRQEDTFLSLWSDLNDYGVAIYAWLSSGRIFSVAMEHWAGNPRDNLEHEMDVDWSLDDLYDSISNGEIGRRIKEWQAQK